MKDQPSTQQALSGLSLEKKRALLAKALADKRRKAQNKASQGPTDAQKMLVGFAQRGAPRLRLLCFPPLAGASAAFASWSHRLPQTIALHGVEFPREDNAKSERTDEEVTSLLDALVEEACALGNQPLALLGESMGAWWACALALALEARGVEVAHLFVLAAAAPGSPDAFPLMEALDDETLLQALVPAQHEQDALRKDPSTHQRLLRHARDDAGWAVALRASLRKSPQQLRCPITAWGGKEDTYVPVASLLGWQENTQGSFSLRLFSGGHGFARVHDELLTPLAQALSLEGPLIAASPTARPPLPETQASLDFGLFYFSCNEADYEKDKYQLLLESVAFAERQGFRGVWLPERHFHPVGGLFPSPSVLAAALSQRTSRLRLRAGSVVLPLHDPIRVAEEWSVVDNLSGGRVGLSVVPGWNPNDYTLSPDAYQTRWERTFAHIETLRTLWRGEAITRRNGNDEDVQVRLHPKPCQPTLPLWVTTSSREESFVRAGKLGAHLLTALLTQSVEDLAHRISLYREARESAGYDPKTGRVALMVHTFVGTTEQAVRENVKGPFMEYMHSVQSLWKDAVASLRLDTPEQRKRVIEMVYERYFQKSTLFGTVEECLRRAKAYQQAGVDELACAIDFGVPLEETLASLAQLDRVRRHFLLASTQIPDKELP